MQSKATTNNKVANRNAVLVNCHWIFELVRVNHSSLCFVRVCVMQERWVDKRRTYTDKRKKNAGGKLVEK